MEAEEYANMEVTAKMSGEAYSVLMYAIVTFIAEHPELALSDVHLLNTIEFTRTR